MDGAITNAFYIGLAGSAFFAVFTPYQWLAALFFLGALPVGFLVGQHLEARHRAQAKRRDGQNSN